VWAAEDWLLEMSREGEKETPSQLSKGSFDTSLTVVVSEGLNSRSKIELNGFDLNIEDMDVEYGVPSLDLNRVQNAQCRVQKSKFTQESGSPPRRTDDFGGKF
jgi:hypothetical protein